MTPMRLTNLFLTIPAVLTTTAAWAHPGGHESVTGTAAVIAHLGGSPFHVASIGGVIGIGALVSYALVRSRLTRN